jgi:predicted RNA-binding Zn-ribbon protein involved in translation (DUF1610 family)
MAKKLPVQSVVCTNCQARLEASPRLNLLGLLRFKCPQCTETLLYPMSPRRRKVYIGIAVVFAVLSVALLAFTGRVAIPGILPLAAALGVVQDSTVRKKVAVAEARGPSFQP